MPGEHEPEDRHEGQPDDAHADPEADGRHQPEHPPRRLREEEPLREGDAHEQPEDRRHPHGRLREPALGGGHAEHVLEVQRDEHEDAEHPAEEEREREPERAHRGDRLEDPPRLAEAGGLLLDVQLLGADPHRRPLHVPLARLLQRNEAIASTSASTATANSGARHPNTRARSAEHQRTEELAEVVGHLTTGEHRGRAGTGVVSARRLCCTGSFTRSPKPNPARRHAEQRDGRGQAGAEAEDGRHHRAAGEEPRAPPAAVRPQRGGEAEQDPGDDRHRRQARDLLEIEVEVVLDLRQDDREAGAVERVEEGVAEQHGDRDHRGARGQRARVPDRCPQRARERAQPLAEVATASANALRPCSCGDLAHVETLLMRGPRSGRGCR